MSRPTIVRHGHIYKQLQLDVLATENISEAMSLFKVSNIIFTFLTVHQKCLSASAFL